MDIQNARPGTLIGNRFVLEEPLDQVPFGSAYRAIDTHRTAEALERRALLWILPAHAVTNMASEALRGAFTRIRALRHPSIAQVYELGYAGDACFISSELLDGETLRNVLDHLRPERLDAGEAGEIVRSVGSALAHAHDHDILHGEVRAENVVITMSHDVKLMNFMASRLLRVEPAAARAANDVRDLALLAHELYTGERLGARDRAQHKAPKRLARAIEAALHGGRQGLTVREFLAVAGLDLEPDAPASISPAPPPVPAALPVADRAISRAVAGAEPLELTPLREPAPRRSVWRFAVPFMALAGLAVALHETVGVDGLVAAGRQLQNAGDALRVRAESAMGSVDKPQQQVPAPIPAAAAVQAPVPAAAAAEVPARPAAPPSKPEPPVFSFATRKVTARESQSMVTLDIVRTSGDGPGSVVWWTTEDTAHAREDYASFGKRVERFRPEDNGRRIIIPIVSDSLREATEHFQVHMAAQPDGARTGAIDTVDVTILDDDDS
ncbi:MAG TPA: Calx-beta domain-containing protein [Gammaproteobacteria bacterium]|nr:Calx-beta domain-containing protein [Gammaproteobacteria bacterium]